MSARSAVRQAATKYGYQLAALSFTPTGGTLTSYEDLIENVSVRREMITQEAHALKDVGEYPVPVRERTTIDFSLLVEAALPWVEFSHAADPTGAIVLTPITVTGAKSYRGKFLITTSEFEAPDGAMTCRVSLVSQGVVTFATA